MTFEDKPGTEPQVDLTVAVDSWKQRLFEASPDDMDALSRQAVSELDRLLPYSGEMCAFAGEARWVTVDEAGNDIDHFGYLAAEGKSHGFEVRAIRPGDRPEPYLSFYIGTSLLWPKPTHGVQHHFLAYLDTDAVVLPASKLAEVFEEVTDGQELASSLDTFSDDMLEGAREIAMLYESIRFRKANLSLQQDLVDAITRKYDTRYLGMRGMRMVLQTEHCVRTKVESGAVVRELTDVTGGRLQALFMGFDCLERSRLTTKAIRQDKDIPPTAWGFGMLLQVIGYDGPTKFNEDEVVLVPSSNQQLNMGFSSEG